MTKFSFFVFPAQNHFPNSQAGRQSKPKLYFLQVTFTESGEVLYSGRMLETINYMRCKEADKIVPSVTMSGVSPNVSHHV